MNLLNKSSHVIARLYRERLAFVRTLPISEQWKHGQELKLLRNSFQVIKEQESIK